MKNNTRAIFNSRIGAILATAGSAVGLGNIWRFPYTLGENGGAAFLLIYILCVIILGLPVMLSEFYIGHKTHSNATGAFKLLAPKSNWSLIGYNGILATCFIFGFYSVIAGWTLEYFTHSMVGGFEGKSPLELQIYFNNFSSSIFRPLLWTSVFIFITHLIVVSGVKRGVEKAAKILMPLLFVILIMMSIQSLSLEYASKGLLFLFKPDFSKITATVVLNAMGQAFFSLSVGICCLATFASYFDNQTNLQQSALQVTMIDTLVALLAGIIIFPAVFSFGIAPTTGPKLVFITIPQVLIQLPFGNIWAFIFFLLLALAALTSTISLLEVPTVYIQEEFHTSRRTASRIASLFIWVLGILCTLYFNVLADIKLFDLTFFELLDFATAKLMLPLGGLFICLFMNKHVKKEDLRAIMTNHGNTVFYFFNTFVFFVRWVAPILIILVFLNQFGLI